MSWQSVFSILIQVFGIVVAIGIARYAWQRRSIPGAEFFALYMLAAVVWALGAVLMPLTSGRMLGGLWQLIPSVGILVMPAAWLAFTLKYTGRGKQLKTLAWVLLAIILLILLSPGVHLVFTLWAQAASWLPIAPPDPFIALIVQSAFQLYVSLTLVSGALFLILDLMRAPRVYRGQYLTLLIGGLAPWSFGLPMVWGNNQIPYEWTSLSFAIGGLVCVWGISRFQIFQVLPVVLDTVVESINDGVVILDLQDRIIHLNPAARGMFSLSAKHIQGIPIRQLLSECGEICDYLDQGQSQAEISLGEAGDQRYYELRISPLYDRRRLLSGRLILLHDITERKRADAELRRISAEAQAANRAKSVFLANMSHELRTPLNAILGFSELMTHDPGLTADQRGNLQIIGRSGRHLLNLINDILEMSKIEVGRTTLNEQGVDLYRLLDDLETMFRLRAEGKGLQLLFDRAANVPPYVQTDEGKLRQVLINLLSNAVKFTTEGGVTLRIGAGQESPAANAPLRLEFEVEDTGPGIAAAEVQQIFEPFVQTASGIKSQEGTGLGLAISRQFVRLLGGDLTVSSTVGQGSIFRFTARVTLADASQIHAEEPTRRVIGLEPGQPVYRILIVEDRDTNRELLAKMLKPLGFAVREAVNGQEALAVWEEWEPQLIWMDMRMPVMDGYEATRRIKATTKGHATVVIALTASAFEEDRAVILAEGCDDLVRKPFREAEIFDKMAKHLGIRFVYAEGPTPAPVPPERIEAALSPTVMATLPGDWVADLHQAAVQADAELILDLLERVRAQHPSVAEGFASLVNNFRFDLISTLTEPATGKR